MKISPAQKKLLKNRKKKSYPYYERNQKIRRDDKNIRKIKDGEISTRWENL